MPIDLFKKIFNYYSPNIVSSDLMFKDLDKKIIKFDPNDPDALLLKDNVQEPKEIYSSNIIYLEDYLQ